MAPTGDKLPGVVFDRPTYFAFKKAYAYAVAHGRETFNFEGHLILVSYAEYVIEHLAPRFEEKR